MPGPIQSAPQPRPALSNPGLTGNLALALDGTAAPSLLCNPVANGGEVVGKIAVVDRGSCNFTVKVKNAQNAGAIAVVVINNVGGVPPAMGGTDNTIVIPSVSITQSDGALIRTTLLEDADPGSLAFDSAAFQVSEDSELGFATITVRRSGGTSGTVSADYASSDGTAQAMLDYAFAGGTVVFGDGQGWHSDLRCRDR